MSTILAHLWVPRFGALSAGEIPVLGSQGSWRPRKFVLDIDQMTIKVTKLAGVERHDIKVSDIANVVPFAVSESEPVTVELGGNKSVKGFLSGHIGLRIWASQGRYLCMVFESADAQDKFHRLLDEVMCEMLTNEVFRDSEPDTSSKQKPKPSGVTVRLGPKPDSAYFVEKFLSGQNSAVKTEAELPSTEPPNNGEIMFYNSYNSDVGKWQVRVKSGKLLLKKIGKSTISKIISAGEEFELDIDKIQIAFDKPWMPEFCLEEKSSAEAVTVKRIYATFESLEKRVKWEEWLSFMGVTKAPITNDFSKTGGQELKQSESRLDVTNKSFNQQVKTSGDDSQLGSLMRNSFQISVFESTTNSTLSPVQSSSTTRFDFDRAPVSLFTRRESVVSPSRRSTSPKSTLQRRNRTTDDQPQGREQVRFESTLSKPNAPLKIQEVAKEKEMYVMQSSCPWLKDEPLTMSPRVLEGNCFDDEKVKPTVLSVTEVRKQAYRCAGKEEYAEKMEQSSPSSITDKTNTSPFRKSSKQTMPSSDKVPFLAGFVASQGQRRPGKESSRAGLPSPNEPETALPFCASTKSPKQREEVLTYAPFFEERTTSPTRPSRHPKIEPRRLNVEPVDGSVLANANEFSFGFTGFFRKSEVEKKPSKMDGFDNLVPDSRERVALIQASSTDSPVTVDAPSRTAAPASRALDSDHSKNGFSLDKIVLVSALPHCTAPPLSKTQLLLVAAGVPTTCPLCQANKQEVPRCIATGRPHVIIEQLSAFPSQTVSLPSSSIAEKWQSRRL